MIRVQRMRCPVCKNSPVLRKICTGCTGKGEAAVVIHSDADIEVFDVDQEATLRARYESTPIMTETDIHREAQFRRSNPRRAYITTRSGIQFVLEDPTPDMITIEDIAHALSQICHFGGHMSHFFSVAQHSVCVAKICPPELKAWGLLHDASEAYIGDMTRPLKYLLPEYRIIESRIMKVIAEKFGLVWPEPPSLKNFDDSIIKLEAALYMNNAVLSARTGEPANIADAPPIPEYFIEPMSPTNARNAFLSAYRRIILDEDGL